MTEPTPGCCSYCKDPSACTDGCKRQPTSDSSALTYQKAVRDLNRMNDKGEIPPSRS